MKFKDRTNRRYGRLTVLERSSRNGYGLHWLCRCRCGNLTEVSAGNLQSKHTRSCGYLARDQARINISLSWK